MFLCQLEPTKVGYLLKAYFRKNGMVLECCESFTIFFNQRIEQRLAALRMPLMILFLIKGLICGTGHILGTGERNQRENGFLLLAGVIYWNKPEL